MHTKRPCTSFLFGKKLNMANSGTTMGQRWFRMVEQLWPNVGPTLVYIAINICKTDNLTV